MRTHVSSLTKMLAALYVSDLTCSTTKENALVKDEQRTFDEEMGYIKQISPCCYTIKKGCVPNMKVMTQ